jgi:sulfonate transport system ATP-binding protein
MYGQGMTSNGLGTTVAQARLAVSVEHAEKAFGERVVFDDFKLQIRENEFVALLGASGSGKTTLLRMLAGLDRLDSGDVLVPPVRTVVFQEPRLVPSKRVLANVLLGLRPTQENKDIARARLKEVGLDRNERSWPATLSGGEAQRVALARALLREPQLLLLDEPFASLDALTRLNMQQLVVDLCRRHKPAVLLVTHDVDEAILLADRIVVLADGHAVYDEQVKLHGDARRYGPGFDALRVDLLTQLGVEFRSDRPVAADRRSPGSGQEPDPPTAVPEPSLAS